MRYSLGSRLLARAHGDHLADDRDVRRRLAKALRHHTGAEGKPTQPVAEVLDGSEFRKWRNKQLRRMPGARIPEHQKGRYAVVVFLLEPAELTAFVRQRHTSRRPPFVGQFDETVESGIGLAGTLAGVLEAQPKPLALAPPVVLGATGPVIADLGLDDWQLERPEIA